jgi:hypothetical protein
VRTTCGVITISIAAARVRRVTIFFVSFVVGALLGDAFTDVIF